MPRVLDLDGNAALTCAPLTQGRMTALGDNYIGPRVTCAVRARDACVHDNSENIIVKQIKELLGASKSLDIRVLQSTACVCTSRACVLVYSHSVLTPPPKEDLT